MATSHFASRTKKETQPPAPIKDAPMFFTMPSKYRGGQVEQLVMAAKKPITPPTPVPTPPPKPTLPPTVPKQQVKKSNKNKIIFLVVGILLLAGLFIGAYVYVQSLTKPPEVTPPVDVPIVVTPEPIPEPPITTPPVVTPPITSPFPTTNRVTGVDSDSDGLTDKEETTLYNTDPRRPDSDNDGFLDGNEVFHRYNPNGDAPGTLEEAGLVKLFAFKNVLTSDVSILYPTSWSAVEDSSPIEVGAITTASFTSSTGERFTAEIYPKPSGQAISEWLATNNKTQVGEVGRTKNGLLLFTSRDQLFAVIDGGESVFILTYKANESGAIEYLQTFKMMINSVSFIAKATTETSAETTAEITVTSTTTTEAPTATENTTGTTAETTATTTSETTTPDTATTSETTTPDALEEPAI